MSYIKKIVGYFSLINYRILVKNSLLISKQKANSKLIPIIIINYNQLFFLQHLVNFLISRRFENIIIIDNDSDFPPLLSYYKNLPKSVILERMDKNEGHMVFFNNPILQEKYGKGFYVVTDSDIVLNNELPLDFMDEMLQYMDKYFKRITKVGLALDIKNLPDFYPLKNKVIEWEKQFWTQEIEPNIFKASVDTTFALYKPQYPKSFNNVNFLRGIRMAGKFTAKHGGWYIDPLNYSEENLHYIKSVKKSSSWKLDEAGKHDNKGDSKYD